MRKIHLILLTRLDSQGNASEYKNTWRKEKVKINFPEDSYKVGYNPNGETEDIKYFSAESDNVKFTVLSGDNLKIRRYEHNEDVFSYLDVITDLFFALRCIVRIDSEYKNKHLPGEGVTTIVAIHWNSGDYYQKLRERLSEGTDPSADDFRTKYKNLSKLCGEKTIRDVLKFDDNIHVLTYSIGGNETIKDEIEIMVKCLENNCPKDGFKNAFHALLNGIVKTRYSHVYAFHLNRLLGSLRLLYEDCANKHGNDRVSLFETLRYYLGNDAVSKPATEFKLTTESDKIMEVRIREHFHKSGQAQDSIKEKYSIGYCLNYLEGSSGANRDELLDVIEALRNKINEIKQIKLIEI